MTDLPSVPVVSLPGSSTWEWGYEMGAALDALFPGQEAGDFASALAHNSGDIPDGVRDHQILGLVCTQVGANDERAWIWHVDIEGAGHWIVEGSCDYTGWDCQSGTSWERANVIDVEVVEDQPAVAALTPGTDPESDPLVRLLYATTDAQVWAREFMAVVEANAEGVKGGDWHLPFDFLTEGFMVGWFANAIETAKRHQSEIDLGRTGD